MLSIPEADLRIPQNFVKILEFQKFGLNGLSSNEQTCIIRSVNFLSFDNMGYCNHRNSA